MRCKPLILLGTLIIILTLTGLAGAADELTLKQQQYNQKLDQLTKLNTQVNAADADYQKALAQFEAVQKTTQTKQDDYNKAKDDYDRASKNVDLVSPDKLAELARVAEHPHFEVEGASKPTPKSRA